MPPVRLTERQQEVLDFIAAYSQEHGYPPAGRELAEGCHLGSPSGAHRMITILERKGYLVRVPGVSRGLSVVQPRIDYSIFPPGDLAKLWAIGETMAIMRDVDLLVAASHREREVKERLMDDARARHERWVLISESLAPFGFEAEPAMVSCVARVKDLHLGDVAVPDWPMFVVDRYMYASLDASAGERWFAMGPPYSAIYENDMAATRERAENAKDWLIGLLSNTSDPEVLAAIRERASFYLQTMGRLLDDVERATPDGSLPAAEALDPDLGLAFLPAPQPSGT